MYLMLRAGVNKLIKRSGSLIAIECMTRELFEDESLSQLVTSDKINDWVAATSTSGSVSLCVKIVSIFGK